jgi:hypothetical protein
MYSLLTLAARTLLA